MTDADATMGDAQLSPRLMITKMVLVSQELRRREGDRPFPQALLLAARTCVEINQ